MFFFFFEKVIYLKLQNCLTSMSITNQNQKYIFCGGKRKVQKQIVFRHKL